VIAKSDSLLPLRHRRGKIRSERVATAPHHAMHRSERSVVVTHGSSAGFHSGCITECGGRERSEFSYSGPLRRAPFLYRSVEGLKTNVVSPLLRRLRHFHLPVLPAVLPHDPDSDAFFQKVGRGLGTLTVEHLRILEPEYWWQSPVRIFPL